MFKRIVMALVVVAAFATAMGIADTADARWRHRRGWRRPVLVGPPVVLRESYYPARYYYGHGPYWGLRYGRGVRLSIGW